MVYNPLGRNWTGTLRVPLTHSTVQVTAASDGKELVSQVYTTVVHYLLASTLSTTGNTRIYSNRDGKREERNSSL